jgi:hypothetical protein
VLKLGLCDVDIALIISALNSGVRFLQLLNRTINLTRIDYIEDPDNGFDAGNIYLKQYLQKTKEEAEALRIAKAQEAEKNTIKTADQHLPNDA